MKQIKKFNLFILGAALLVWPGFSLAQEQTEYFFIDPGYDYNSRTEIQADLLYTTEHAYVYVERDWWRTLNASAEKQNQKYISDVINEFNMRIYPLLTASYGSEWKPGIDNDTRLTVLFTQMREGVAGYFNSVDENLQEKIKNSNEREMIYLSTRFLGEDRIKAFLAHEFQHLITYYQKTVRQNIYEDTWLNEARSEYVPTLLGYDDYWQGSNLSRRVEEFLKSPSNSLTEWQNTFADYGIANVFMQYLVDQYGAKIMELTTQNSQIGAESIQSALTALGFDKTFSDVFSNWSIAVYLNNCEIEPIETYCYKNPNLPFERLHVSLDLTGSGESISQASLIKDWAAQWYQVDYILASKVLKVDFVSNDSRANFRIPYILFHNDGSKEISEVIISKNPQGESSTMYIENFGKDIVSAVFIPHNENKLTGFSNSEPEIDYYLNFSLVNEIPVYDNTEPEQNDPTSVITGPGYPEGALIRKKGDYRVYVIKGKYKRWIQSPEIMDMYPHFQWQGVIDVSAQDFDFYQDAWLIRASGDKRVYEINGDGTKHWLDMTPQWFAQSGRDWDMVYIINNQERDWYKNGVSVLR